MTDEELNRKIAEFLEPFDPVSTQIPRTLAWRVVDQHRDGWWIKYGPADFVADPVMTVLLMKSIIKFSGFEPIIYQMRKAEPSWINDKTGYASTLQRSVAIAFAKANGICI